MFRYFTIKSANKALPVIKKKFQKVIEQKKEVVKLQQDLDATLVATHKFEQYMNIKQKLNSAVTKFYQAIEDLENTGAVLKGIDEGLVDFPSKRFDEEVWLCWKDGESEIKFWHEKDVGFNGRKPISVSDESLV